MRIKFNDRTGRLEAKTKKRLFFISFDAWSGVYYIIPTIRIDNRRSYGNKSVWFFFLGMFLLIDIFKIKD